MLDDCVKIYFRSAQRFGKYYTPRYEKTGGNVGMTKKDILTEVGGINVLAIFTLFTLLPRLCVMHASQQ